MWRLPSPALRRAGAPASPPTSSARILSERDAHRLHAIAIDARQNAPALAAALLEELGRAAIRPDAEAPPEHVALGSTVVCFESAGARSRYHHMRIVAPEDAAPALGRVSVLTELGAALIGLAQHQSFTWRDALGAARRFCVLEVEARAPGVPAQPLTQPPVQEPRRCA